LCYWRGEERFEKYSHRKFVVALKREVCGTVESKESMSLFIGSPFVLSGFEQVFRDLPREKPSAFLLSGWSSVSDDGFHTSGFLGQDTGLIKVDMVTQVYAVLDNSHIIQSDVLSVLLGPGLNGMPGLSNVDPHSQEMLYKPCALKRRSSLMGLKKLVPFLGWGYSFDVMSQ
jgi:hypothetical protein